MAMTKAQLLASLAAMSNIKAVGVPEITQAEDAMGVTWYMVNVFETGLSKTGQPIAQRKNISFYVFNEGEATEDAMFMQDEPRAELDKVVRTNSDSLEAIYRVFSSDVLRAKLCGALIQISHNVFGEDPLTASHDLRIKLAVGIKMDCNTYLPVFAQLAAMEAGIRATAEDTEDSVFITLVTNLFTAVATYIFA
jgi:hypothetical protein